MAIDKINATALLDGGVSTADIADDAITQAKVADDAIGTPQIADGAVDTSQLAVNSVTTAKIGASQITDAKIATGIAASKLTGALPAISGASLTGIEAAGRFLSMQVFTTTGANTWTKPSGVNKVKVYVTGGGGGGYSCLLYTSPSPRD